MKNLFRALFVGLLLVGLVACNNQELPEEIYDGAPKIIFDGNSYFANSLEIVSELPEGYVYAGKLSEEDLKYAAIDGNQYYIQENQEIATDFFVYQECGTRVDEHLVDSAQRQWAYVKWLLEEE